MSKLYLHVILRHSNPTVSPIPFLLFVISVGTHGTWFVFQGDPTQFNETLTDKTNSCFTDMIECGLFTVECSSSTTLQGSVNIRKSGNCIRWSGLLARRLLWNMNGGSDALLPNSKSTFSQHFTEGKCISEVVRIGRIIIFYLSKRWKAMFSILCDVIFLVRLQWKFEIDHWLGGEVTGTGKQEGIPRNQNHIPRT